MAEKLLINVAHEETRVALVESGRLANFEIITSLADNNKGSIFKGIVHRVNASLQAAFVDYGAEKQGFLPLAEVHQRYYPKNFDKNSNRRATIMDVLKQGQEVMVQVVKDEIGQKGATLTTYISLAGRSLAIEADSEKAGISRRVSQDERNRLRKVMKELDVPEGFGAIMRTAAADQDDDDIHSNQNYLMMQWNNVQERFRTQKHPGLIHQELPLPLRFIRDSLSNSVDEILVDDQKTYEEVRNFCVGVAPELVPRVKLYNDPRPLFFRFQVEEQIDDIFARKIDLPSGGSIVIDQAEALVAIDVNSGRVKTDDIEDTATKTNLEAAAEIARQLKIRDRGGLIVVDFIDMRDKENVRKVEETIRQAFSTDKAKVKFSRISEFGLMEISRQRLQSSVMRGSFTNCHTCGGTGQIRSIESSSLFILRRLKEILIRGNYERVEARMPVGVANYLLNRKRQDLVALEKQTTCSIEVMAEEHCPAMKAYFELTTKATSSQRKARRVVQEIDLVRSEVDKRDLEEGEVITIEKESTKEAEPSVFAASREKLDEQNRELEGGIARQREIEIAQKEADEALRRQEELRLEKERLEAETERIRALDTARRASLGLWGRVKAFFGGLPPITVDEPASRAGERPRRKKRDDDARRTEARRDRDERKRPEKKVEDKERVEKLDKTDKPEKSERRSRDRDGGDRSKRQRYPARVEGAGELVEAGGAVVQPAVGGAPTPSAASDAAKKKRRRRRGGRGRDGEGAEGQLEGGVDESGELDGDADESAVAEAEAAEVGAEAEGEATEGRQGQREGRNRNRDGRGRGRDRDGRNRNRREDGAKGDAADGASETVDAGARSEEAAPAAVAAPAPVADVKPPKKGVGVVDLRQDRSRPVETTRPATPAVPAPAPVVPQAEGSKPSLPRFGGVIDLRGGGAPAPARPAAPARPTTAPAMAAAPAPAPVTKEVAKEAAPVETVAPVEAKPAEAKPAEVTVAEVTVAEVTVAEVATEEGVVEVVVAEVAEETVEEAEVSDEADVDAEAADGDDTDEDAATPEKPRRAPRQRRAPKAADGNTKAGDKKDA